MALTTIEWTECSWNPVTGCSKISAGCEHCYAERMAKRLRAMGQPRYANGFKVTIHYDMVETPLKWKSPRSIFVNSMSDLFHERVPWAFIESFIPYSLKFPSTSAVAMMKRSELALRRPDYFRVHASIDVLLEDDRIEGLRRHEHGV
jgi:protein gp37